MLRRHEKGGKENLVFLLWLFTSRVLFFLSFYFIHFFFASFSVVIFQHLDTRNHLNIHRDYLK